MAYIKKRGDYWRAEVRRKGHKPVYRTFDTQLEAQKWARRLEPDIDTGFYVDNSAAEKMTLAAALEQYRREVAAKKRHPAQENGRIDRWLRSDLCYRTLANLKGADFAKYRDQRRDQGRAENTIRLELQLVSHLYEMGRSAEAIDQDPAVGPRSRQQRGSSCTAVIDKGTCGAAGLASNRRRRWAADAANWASAEHDTECSEVYLEAGIAGTWRRES